MARGKNCTTAAKQLGQDPRPIHYSVQPECFPHEGLYYVHRDTVEILAKECALNQMQSPPYSQHQFMVVACSAPSATSTGELPWGDSSGSNW